MDIGLATLYHTIDISLANPAVERWLTRRYYTGYRTESARIRGGNDEDQDLTLWQAWELIGAVKSLHVQPQYHDLEIGPVDVQLPWSELQHLSFDFSLAPEATLRRLWKDIMKKSPSALDLHSLSLYHFTYTNYKRFGPFTFPPMRARHVEYRQGFGDSGVGIPSTNRSYLPSLPIVAHLVEKVVCNVTSISWLDTFIQAEGLDVALTHVGSSLTYLKLCTSRCYALHGSAYKMVRFLWDNWDMRSLALCTQLRELVLITQGDEPALHSVILPSSLRIFRLSWLPRLRFVLWRMQPEWFRRNSHLELLVLDSEGYCEASLIPSTLFEGDRKTLQAIDTTCREEGIRTEPASLLSCIRCY